MGRLIHSYIHTCNHMHIYVYMCVLQMALTMKMQSNPRILRIKTNQSSIMRAVLTDRWGELTTLLDVHTVLALGKPSLSRIADEKADGCCRNLSVSNNTKLAFLPRVSLVGTYLGDTPPSR